MERVIEPEIVDAMAEENRGETVLVPEVISVPTPAALPLRNADDVRLEMAKVYREMRGGAMDPAFGAKLVWVLSQLNRTIETSVIEHRVEAIEQVLRRTR